MMKVYGKKLKAQLKIDPYIWYHGSDSCFGG